MNNPMENHTKIFSWATYIWGAVSMPGLVLMGCGLAASWARSGRVDALIAGVFTMMALFSGLLLLVSRGMSRHTVWARPLTFVFCLGLVLIGRGSAGSLLGFYGLWILIHPDTAALFARSEARAHRIRTTEEVLRELDQPLPV